MYIILIKCHVLFEFSVRSWVGCRNRTIPHLISDPSIFVPKYILRPSVGGWAGLPRVAQE